MILEWRIIFSRIYFYETIIEAGSREKILSYSSTLNPHPYVMELLQATPSLNGFH